MAFVATRGLGPMEIEASDVASNAADDWHSLRTPQQSPVSDGYLDTTSGDTESRSGEVVDDSCRAFSASEAVPGDDVDKETAGLVHRDVVDLYCTETLLSPRATDDRRRVAGDFRVLTELLAAESRYQLRASPYDDRTQPEIKESMRVQLASWIFEICDSNFSNGGVFPLTMHLVDSFLSLPSFHRRAKAAEFQLIGAVCLFIASKFIDCSEETCLAASQLIRYTNFSITRTQLLDWEMAVLQAFNWDLYAITPFDFVDHILCHLSLGGENVANRVRRHAITFVALCAHANHPPSTVASACLRLGVSVTLGDKWCKDNRIDQCLFQITHTEPDYVTACCHQIELAIARYSSGLRQTSAKDDGLLQYHHDNALPGLDSTQRNAPPDTPTDIRDISPDDFRSSTGRIQK